MSLLENLKGLFASKKGIDRITIDELKHEKIRLEQMERRVSKEIDSLEARKQELFLKGKDESSTRQRLALARKIKELDGTVKAKDRQLQFFHKHIRIVDGLLQIKENMALLQELKVGSVVSQMSLEELTAYVEKASIEGQFEMEKFTTLLGSLEAAMEATEEPAADEDVVAIVAAMEQARAAEEAGDLEGVTQAALRVDEVLDKESGQDRDAAGDA